MSDKYFLKNTGDGGISFNLPNVDLVLVLQSGETTEVNLRQAQAAQQFLSTMSLEITQFDEEAHARSLVRASQEQSESRRLADESKKLNQEKETKRLADEKAELLKQATLDEEKKKLAEEKANTSQSSEKENKDTSKTE